MTSDEKIAQITERLARARYSNIAQAGRLHALSALLVAYTQRKGQALSSQAAESTALAFDTEIERYFGLELAFDEVLLALDWGMHREFGEYSGINVDRMFDFVRQYRNSSERQEALKQFKVRTASPGRKILTAEETGRLNWNAMLGYTRERWQEFCSSGSLEELGSTRGEILFQALGTVQRHNMANAYKWLKSVGVIEVDTTCMALEAKSLREAARLLGDDAPCRKAEDLAYARLLEGFFAVCRSQRFDLTSVLSELDRDTPTGERRFW